MILQRTLCFFLFLTMLAPVFPGTSTAGLIPLVDSGVELPIPDELPALARAKDLDSVVSALTGVAYRPDGAIDEQGRFTLFAERSRLFKTAGLNCSGFLVEACRFLLGRTVPLDEAARDRLGDSGPGSPHGRDWDFGWDLVLNLSQGLPRRLLLPEGKTVDPENLDGYAARGFDLHDPETWRELPERIRPGYLYLVSFSKETNTAGYALLHYHVALMHRDGNNDIRISQATTQSGKVTSRSIGTPEGRDLFLRSFTNRGGNRKMIAVVEVDLP